MKKIKAKADFLIEVSYEIVKQLGGIHTVIKTKAPFIKKYYGENYLVIGVYTKEGIKKRFKARKPSKEIRKLFLELKNEKILARYGTWLVKSNPKAILIDTRKLRKDKKIKSIIKKEYGIGLSSKDYYQRDSFLFGYAAGRLIYELRKLNFLKNKKIVVNAHEYMSGLCLLYLRKHKANLPLVFTTHATVLGRTISYKGENIQKTILRLSKKGKHEHEKKVKEYIKKINKITYTKHLVEKACSKKADVFTTVSETTSKEAAFLLGKKADIITPNGLEIIKHPSIDEQLAINYKSKQKIYRFLEAYFYPYYWINTKDSLLFYTSGRNEIYTKGYDLFFEALNKLNSRLKREKYEGNIFVFLFIMIRKKRIKKIIKKTLYAYRKNKKLLKKIKLTKNPPNCAFDTRGDNTVLMYLKKNKLENKKSDKVKVIFYPAPVEENDGLLSMSYKEIISGMDLGIFPSLYEPWGYTPLESAAMSTITITTDIAGFGRFIKEKSDQRKRQGIIVLRTKRKTRLEIIENLAKTMQEIVNMPKEKRLKMRIDANKLSGFANWEEFSKNYIKAHNLALEKHKK